MNDSPEPNSSRFSNFEKVLEFHQHTGACIDGPFHDWDNARLRVDLIQEEFERELMPAWRAQDFVAVADALGDLAYVVYGAAISIGIDLDSVVDEIHRSNMTKLNPDGTPVLREDGKILKGPNYEPPILTTEVIRGRFQS
ncbi:MAG: pyrophosphohydrolase domain-containing protein [bacterium]